MQNTITRYQIAISRECVHNIDHALFSMHLIWIKWMKTHWKYRIMNVSPSTFGLAIIPSFVRCHLFSSDPPCPVFGCQKFLSSIFWVWINCMCLIFSFRKDALYFPLCLGVPRTIVFSCRGWRFGLGFLSLSPHHTHQVFVLQLCVCVQHT